MSSFDVPLSKIDQFGASLKLSFRKHDVHGTTAGGIYTIIACICIAAGIVYYGEDLVYRQSPQTIISEEKVHSPEVKKLNPKTFTLTFGVEDSITWNHIIDPRIYRVAASNHKLVKVFNNKTNTYLHEQFSIDLGPVPCKVGSSYFNVENTVEYFEQLVGVPQMYCLNYTENNSGQYFETSDGQLISKDVELEGDFTADILSTLELVFRTCVNLTLAEIAAGKIQLVPCLPQEEIDLHLQSSYIGMYFTHQSFDPNNYKFPFSNTGADLFWPTSNYLTKYISITYKNTYIETNTGLFFNEVEVQKGFQYAGDKEQLTHVIDNRFAIIQIRFQKSIQDRIFRRYKRIGQVIAEIGGIATFLRIVGFLLVYPISLLNLRMNLINELFSFSNSTQNRRKHFELQNIINQVPINDLNNIEEQTLSRADVFRSKRDRISEIKLGNFGLDNKIGISSSINSQGLKILASDEENPISFTKGENHLLSSRFSHTNIVQNIMDLPSMKRSTIRSEVQKVQPQHDLQQSESDIQQIFQPDRKNLQLSPIEYIMLYVCPCLKRIRSKRNQMSYCNSIIDTQLDGVFILRKLLELDKLKALLFSETQLKLFDFIPKPLLQEESFNQTIPIKQTNVTKLPATVDKDFNEETISLHLKQFHLLNVDHKPDSMKAQEAFEAFKELTSKNILTRKEKRILQMIHPSFAKDEEHNSPFQKPCLFDRDDRATMIDSTPIKFIARPLQFLPGKTNIIDVNNNNQTEEVKKPEMEIQQIQKVISKDKQGKTNRTLQSENYNVSEFKQYEKIPHQSKQSLISSVQFDIIDVQLESQVRLREQSDVNNIDSNEGDLSQNRHTLKQKDATAAQIYQMSFKNTIISDSQLPKQQIKRF